MKHPQPAFDLLTSLPIDAPVEESIFVDWHAFVDADKGDDITNHPEIWTEYELPDVLDKLSTDDFVTFQLFNDNLNLNAIAIGLGLEDIKYEPETFPGLVYDLEEYNATALLFLKNILFTVGETEDTTSESLDFVIERLEMLGLRDDIELEGNQQTCQVSEIIRD